MILPPTEGVRVVRRGVDADAAAAWARVLGRIEPERVLKRDKRSSVVLASLEGSGRVVIKTRVLAGAGDAVKSAARWTQGHRYWRGWRWLRGHEFAAARPLVLVHGRREGVRLECLVTEALAGGTVLAHIAGAGETGSVQREHVLAAALGEQIAGLVRRGRYNRDHKPSNLIVIRLTDTEAEIALIDCVAIRPVRASSGDRAARMLAQLMIEPTGVGYPPRRALAMRAVVRCAVSLGDGRGAKVLWRAAARIVARAGDPRPKVDPLSEEAGVKSKYAEGEGDEGVGAPTPRDRTDAPSV